MANFQILMIDPAWLKKKGGLRKARPNQGKELDYPTMPTKEIFELLDKEIFSQTEETQKLHKSTTAEHSTNVH